MLHLENLQCQYGESVDGLIFDDVEVMLPSGQILAIFGPNGCGKTSLLNTIIGHFVGDGREQRFAPTVLSRGVSLVPQDYRASFFPGISLRRNCVLVQSKRSSSSDLDARLDALIDFFQIPFEFGLRPSECSGGMLQQAAIIRALLANPALILADEPFAAMDVETAARMRSKFREHLLKNQASALVILHGIEDLTAVADKVFVIPDKPYSSLPNEGFNQVEILENFARTKVETGVSLSFNEIARNVFGRQTTK